MRWWTTSCLSSVVSLLQEVQDNGASNEQLDVDMFADVRGVPMKAFESSTRVMFEFFAVRGRTAMHKNAQSCSQQSNTEDEQPSAA